METMVYSIANILFWMFIFCIIAIVVFVAVFTVADSNIDYVEKKEAKEKQKRAYELLHELRVERRKE